MSSTSANSSHKRLPVKSWADSFDMYRKIPVDLMEGSRRGSILSYVAAVLMLFLFLLETKDYLETKYVVLLSLVLVYKTGNVHD
jgi:hypothetical protein